MPLTDEGRVKGLAVMQASNEKRKTLKLEDLKEKTSYLLSQMFDHLMVVNPQTGVTEWQNLLNTTKGKDLMVMFGILTEKFLLTQGQATTIVMHQEQQTMDSLTEAFMLEAKRRQLAKRPLTLEATVQPE